MSSGKEASEVPNVVGKSEGTAKTMLDNAGFKVSTERQSSDSVKQGNVISQTPDGGSSLEPGKTVHLVISTGPSSSGGTSGGGSGSNGGSGNNSSSGN